MQVDSLPTELPGKPFNILVVYFSDVAVYRGPKCGVIMLSDIPKHKLIVSI